jgi:hypothetical protein
MGGRTRIADWAPAAMLAVAGASAAVALQYQPTDSSFATAVFPPWWTSGEAIQAAGSVGDILSIGGFARAVAIRSEAPDLAARAKAAGAIMVLRGTTAGLCATPTREPSKDGAA